MEGAPWKDDHYPGYSSQSSGSYHRLSGWAGSKIQGEWRSWAYCSTVYRSSTRTWAYLALLRPKLYRCWWLSIQILWARAPQVWEQWWQKKVVYLSGISSSQYSGTMWVWKIIWICSIFPRAHQIFRICRSPFRTNLWSRSENIDTWPLDFQACSLQSRDCFLPLRPPYTKLEQHQFPFQFLQLWLASRWSRWTFLLKPRGH